jgi:hypothetical protein
MPGGLLQEPDNWCGYLGVLDVSSAYFIGDVGSHVARPAFSRIEGDDTDGIFVLPLK